MRDGLTNGKQLSHNGKRPELRKITTAKLELHEESEEAVSEEMERRAKRPGVEDNSERPSLTLNLNIKSNERTQSAKK